jgi:16S rRNA (adenine1518-N6/adenine1519-N6)-dimethyltransferase
MESPAAILRRHGLWAKKSWGQCFLRDAGVVNRIVGAAQLEPEDTVVEIGAGLGGLTLALAARARQVFAIERDRDLVAVLQKELAASASIQIVEANALTYDFSQHPSPVKVVGNIPYNISSPLLFHLLEQGRRIGSATIMVQLEVARRLVAEPGSRVYGVPSVLFQQATAVSLCFRVPRTAFVPQPRVDSAVVYIEPRPSPVVEVDERSFRATVRAAFSARRKTLKNSLSRTFPRQVVESALASSGIDEGRRAETLAVQEFGHLAKTIARMMSQSGRW